jgi:hypothetical protein
LDRIAKVVDVAAHQSGEFGLFGEVLETLDLGRLVKQRRQVPVAVLLSTVLIRTDSIMTGIFRTWLTVLSYA